jgi:hypothetical protein
MLRTNSLLWGHYTSKMYCIHCLKQHLSGWSNIRHQNFTLRIHLKWCCYTRSHVISDKWTFRNSPFHQTFPSASFHLQMTSPAHQPKFENSCINIDPFINHESSQRKRRPTKEGRLCTSNKMDKPYDNLCAAQIFKSSQKTCSTITRFST